MNKKMIAGCVALLMVAGAVIACDGPAPKGGYTTIQQLFLRGGFTTPILKINQTSTGKIVELQDSATPVVSVKDGGDIESNAKMRIGLSGTPQATQAANSLYVKGGVEIDGELRADGGIVGSVSNDLDGGPLYIDPNQSSTLAAAVNGQITVTLPATGTLQVTTGNLRVGNGSNGTTLNGEDLYCEGTSEFDGAAKFDGGLTVTTITGANAETLNNATNGFWDLGAAGLMQTAGTTNGIGFSTWVPANVITTTSGALWTVPSSQKWMVHRVFCQITTNFDCTGDDCALIIGDDTDTDGFLVLADASLQAADTEGTGWPAGWQGFAAATVGAFLDGGAWGFPYVAAQTIDIDIRDASDSSDPTAGAATCWLNYTRFE